MEAKLSKERTWPGRFPAFVRHENWAISFDLDNGRLKERQPLEIHSENNSSNLCFSGDILASTFLSREGISRPGLLLEAASQATKECLGAHSPPPHAPLQVPPPTQGAALQLAVSMVKVRWFPWQQHGSACFLGDEEGEAARLRASVPYPTPTLQRSHSGLPGLGPCVTIMTVLQVIDSIQASRPLFCLGSGCRLAWFGHIISPFGLSVASSVKWS